MSRKLPIAETAVDAVRFGLGSIGPIVRIGWLSLILWIGVILTGGWLVLGGLPMITDAIAAVVAAAQNGEITTGEEVAIIIEDAIDRWDGAFAGEEIARLTLGGLIVLCSGFILWPLFTLSAQVAAGDRDWPKGVFFWRFGGREWRSLLTFIILTIAVEMLTGAVEAVGFIFAEQVGDYGDLTVSWAAGLVPIAVFIVIIWITMRTSLVVAASAIENDINPVEAVMATGGNFFRLIASVILYVVLVAACLVGLALALLIFVLGMGLMSGSVGSETPLGSALIIVMMIGLLGGIFAAILGMNLSNIGWQGVAWRSLRKDRVAACGEDGPDAGAVCEI